MKRIVESELMTDKYQCKQYLLAPKNKFFEAIGKFLPNQIGNKIADLGCGPGDFTNFLANKYENISIDAFDGSQEMLRLAKENFNMFYEIGNLQRVRFINSYIQNIDQVYDFVFCCNTLHHLHDPTILWNTLQNISKDKFMVVDLVRPDSEAQLEEVVSPYEGYADPIFLQDFRNSLRAAFTIEELKSQTKHIDCKIYIVNDFLGHKSQLAIITNYG